jgi:hypothetical protein
MREADRQAEAARTRGTPLTPQAFQEWRIRFTNELKQKREKAEDERIRALPPKEREDVRKRRERLSGKACSSSNPSSFFIIPSATMVLLNIDRRGDRNLIEMEFPISLLIIGNQG